MKRVPIPISFQITADILGVGIRHFINDYAVRDNYLSMDNLGKEEREYLTNLMAGRKARHAKKMRDVKRAEMVVAAEEAAKELADAEAEWEASEKRDAT